MSSALANPVPRRIATGGWRLRNSKLFSTKRPACSGWFDALQYPSLYSGSRRQVWKCALTLGPFRIMLGRPPGFGAIQVAA